jgi:hypothetical protein
MIVVTSGEGLRVGEYESFVSGSITAITGTLLTNNTGTLTVEDARRRYGR